MQCAHGATLVAGLVEGGEDGDVAGVAKCGRVQTEIKKLIVRLVRVRDGAEGLRAAPRVLGTGGALQHDAALLGRRVVDEVGAKYVLDEGAGGAERRGAAGVPAVKEAGQASVQAEDRPALLQVAGERLARGVEDLARVVDQDDQVEGGRSGKLQLRSVVRDNRLVPARGEQQTHVGGGGSGAAVHVVAHGRVDERHLLGRGGLVDGERAGAVLGERDGRGRLGQRRHPSRRQLRQVERTGKTCGVKPKKLVGVGAAGRDGRAAPLRKVVGLGREERVGLGAVRQVECGELGQPPPEPAAGHLIERVARCFGHLSAVVQRGLEGDVVGDAEAGEAEVHHDGVHRHAYQLRPAAAPADRREGAADSAVELGPVSGL
mmetsp:Transcript_7317/g.23321  ORF Transcript_7317/g.23321 Transcript_7317/m.23321 type:complete len:375 (+) Transcript_7317:598-1722(+)